MKKLLSIMLIIIGTLLIFYPKASEYYNDYKRKEIMKNLDVKDNDEEKKHIDVSEDKEEMPNGDILKIEKINLYQPILKGDLEENLKISITSINTNVEPGQKGNYALAGHRSHTYGRNFNRLDELQVGDSIEVYHDKKKYVYVIDKKFQVKPEEVWVLNNNDTESEITLITCTPMINPTHRLIIKGKLS